MPNGGSLARPAVGLLAAAVLLAGIAVAQPYALAAFSVVAFGPLHVLLALRYLTGRSWPALAGSTGRTLLVLVLLMVVVRAITVVDGHLGHQLELIGGTGIVAFALWAGLRGGLRYAAIGAVLTLAVVSALELPWYWHLLTHGHNLVPLVFLWDWARRSRPTARLSFVAANLGWLVGIPAVVLAGLADAWLNPAPPGLVTHLTDPAFLVASAAPPGASPALGLRFLAVFGFLQAMHYVLWMVFFQVHGRPEIRRLERAVPVLAGWRFWAVAAAVCAAIWMSYGIGYAQGRAVYGVLGALNVYVEQPIAIWLLLTALPARPTTTLIAPLRVS